MCKPNVQHFQKEKTAVTLEIGACLGLFGFPGIGHALLPVLDDGLRPSGHNWQLPYKIHSSIVRLLLYIKKW